jgi:4,5:9,10-diseco-3-hydroxy-5,9,17-trioxoandrosta-1(10),2-diene-4-oate hydrolase
MGGTVSLSFALKYPDYVQNVTVIGSPIVGSSLALLLKFAGYRFNAYLLFKFFGVFRAFMYYFYSRIICKHPDFPKMMDDDLTQLFLESFLISIATLRKTDLRPSLDKIKVPVMGMYGDKDLIVSPHQWKDLLAGVPHARIERFPKAGHFIMLDEPENFRNVLKDFLDKQSPSRR